MQAPTREYQSEIYDSTRWDDFQPRPGDVVISTSVKAGTTWAQTIVASLLWPDGNLPGPVNELSPWLELPRGPVEPVLDLLDAQPHRRIIKTHLPADALPLHDEVRYITVGRDGRDVFVSLIHHWEAMRPLVFEMMHAIRPEQRTMDVYHGDLHRAFDEWVSRGAFPWEGDGSPWHSHLHHARSWWERRHLPNVLLLHFDAMLADLKGEMRRVADFIGADVTESQWPEVVDRCTLASMRDRWDAVVPERFAFEGDGSSFLRRGESGQWSEVLTDEENRRYEQRVAEALPPDAAGWLATGRISDTYDPAGV